MLLGRVDRALIFYLRFIMARYIHLHNAVYLNVDLIAHHEPAEGEPFHTKIIFDAQIDGKPLEMVIDVAELELIHMIENAKEYEHEPGFR